MLTKLISQHREHRFAIALAGFLLLGAAASVAEDVPPKLGPDFQVNTFTEGNQDDPAVVRYPDGSFVAAWLDSRNARVKARLYQASGAPLSGEIAVSDVESIIGPPRAAALPDGGFAVVWANLDDVLLRRFDREAHPLADAVVVSESHRDPNRFPDLAGDSAGNLAVVWTSEGFFEDLVLLRRFDAAGNPQGESVQVNTHTTRSPSAAHVAVNDSGSVLVSWDEAVGTHVVARRFDGASGTWSAEVKIVAPHGGHSAGSVPVLYREGDGAVVFGDLRAVDAGVFCQRLDAAAKAAGEAVEIGGGLVRFGELDAAFDGVGKTLVVWSRGSQDAGARIFGRLYDRSWRPLGEAFAVSADPLNPDSQDLQPAVAADAFGGFAVLWSNIGKTIYFFFPQVLDGRDGSQFGVFGQVLGDPECNADPEVLCLGAGNRFHVKVSWQTPGGAGAGHARRLTADTGTFWFFQSGNLELMLKILDGRALNHHFWVFYGALSNVEYTITVTDTATGKENTYTNPAGQLASRADVSAFEDASPPAPAETAPPLPAASGCPGAAPGATLCLNAGRFQVDVVFVDPTTRVPVAGHAVALTADTGVFWFFGPNNLELMIKILDGRPVNGHFWVFYGALSDVQYTITVKDRETGEQRTYVNPHGHLASRADTDAFPITH